MINRKSLNAKKYDGKKYSFHPKKTKNIKKKKNIAQPKDKMFEVLWKSFFGENYVDNWYNAEFRDALTFYKKLNSQKRLEISKQVRKFGKETSDEQKYKISFISVLQNIATSLNFQIKKDFKNKSKIGKIQRPVIIPNTENTHVIVTETQKKLIIQKESNLLEGTPKQIILTKYERNPIARQKCIDHYGASCVICNFNFEYTYGTIGKDFIHVHHLIKVSSQQKEYEIDPVKDLRPVCPNCHAIIHKKKVAFGIDEIREFTKLKP